MAEEASSSHIGADPLAALQQMFPEVEVEVLTTVLEQEGSVEAAMEALLLSTGQIDKQLQIQQDEEVAKALQEQMRPWPGGQSWLGVPRASSTGQEAQGTGDAWQDLHEAASGLLRTVSEYSRSAVESISAWIAPLGEDAEYEDDDPTPRHTDNPHLEFLDSEQRPRAQPENKKDK